MRRSLFGCLMVVAVGCTNRVSGIESARETTDDATPEAADPANDATDDAASAGDTDSDLPAGDDGSHGDFDFGGDPPDLSCLSGSGLTPVELAIAGMSANTWMELPNTDFATFCAGYEDASVHGVSGCNQVILAWSGAIYDDGRRELVLFGGGHGDYYGNEVVAFSTVTGAWHVLRAATPLADGQAPTEPMAGNTPVSRHTYGGLAYLPDIHAMFVFGGATAPNGSSADSVWYYDLDHASWTRMNDGPPTAAGHFYLATAYDALTNRLFMRDENGIWVYDAIADTWDHVIDFGYPPYYPLQMTYHYRSAVLVGNVFVVAGGVRDNGAVDVNVYDTLAEDDVSAGFVMTGDTTAVARNGTGLAYSTRDDAIVAWSGGAPGVMGFVARDWTSGSSTGAPPSQVENGTYGRFRYVAYLNAFILVNAPEQNVYVYKLTAGCGPP